MGCGSSSAVAPKAVHSHTAHGKKNQPYTAYRRPSLDGALIHLPAEEAEPTPGLPDINSVPADVRAGERERRKDPLYVKWFAPRRPIPKTSAAAAMQEPCRRQFPAPDERNSRSSRRRPSQVLDDGEQPCPLLQSEDLFPKLEDKFRFGDFADGAGLAFGSQADGTIISRGYRDFDPRFPDQPNIGACVVGVWCAERGPIAGLCPGADGKERPELEVKAVAYDGVHVAATYRPRPLSVRGSARWA